MAARGFFSLVCIAGVCPNRSITQDDFWGVLLPTSFLGELLKPANLRLFRESELVNEVIYGDWELLLFSWGSQKELCPIICCLRDQPFQLAEISLACWEALVSILPKLGMQQK